MEKDLFYLLGGHIFFQTLSAAVQLDLFSKIEQNQSMNFSQLQDQFKIEKKPMRILLLGLTSLNLVKKENDEYSNTEMTKRYFCRQHPQNYCDIVLWQHFINYKPLYHFKEALQKNTNVGIKEIPGSENTLYERLAHTPLLEKIFQNAMEQISRQAIQEFVEQFNFSGIKHLVDIGGGNGSNLISIIQKNPHLKGTIFDSASVLQQTKQNIESKKLQNRIHTFSGDCFKDSFPNDADAFLFCHFFTIWSEEKGIALLKKAYNALPRGGKAMIFNMLQHDDESGPLTAALGSPYFLTLATGEGMLYTGAEYEKWFKIAGFSKVSRNILPRDHAVIVGIKE